MARADPEAGRRAARELLDSPTPELRHEGLRTLVMVAPSRAAGSRTRWAGSATTRIRQRLSALAHDEEALVRATVVSGLAENQDREADAAALVVALSGDPDGEVRKRVSVAVRHVAPDAAREVLGRLVADPDPTVRWAAELQRKRL